MSRPMPRASYDGGHQEIFLGPRTMQRHLPLNSEAALPLLRMGVILAGISEFDPSMQILRRDHGFHLLCISLAGGAVIELADGIEMVNAGEVWLLPARTAHAYRPCHEGWSVLWFHLSDQICRPDLSKTPISRISWFPDRMPMLAEGFIHEALVGLHNSVSSGQAYATLLRNLIDRFLGVEWAVGATRQRKALDRLLAEVAANIQHPWTVEQMAARLHTSSTHLHRLMKTHSQTHPKTFLRHLRMQKACELLHEPQHTIEMIAEAVGYTCPFSFSKTFKRHTGRNPRDYRKAASARRTGE